MQRAVVRVIEAAAIAARSVVVAATARLTDARLTVNKPRDWKLLANQNRAYSLDSDQTNTKAPIMDTPHRPGLQRL